jgi:hypothetical protein
MSKLSLTRNYIYAEHCNWDFYTPYLGYVIPITNFSKYNIVHNTDNVVYNNFNVVHIGI